MRPPRRRLSRLRPEGSPPDPGRRRHGGERDGARPRPRCPGAGSAHLLLPKPSGCGTGLRRDLHKAPFAPGKGGVRAAVTPGLGRRAPLPTLAAVPPRGAWQLGLRRQRDPAGAGSLPSAPRAAAATCCVGLASCVRETLESLKLSLSPVLSRILLHLMISGQVLTSKS